MPITPTSPGNGESTPLRRSKLVDTLALPVDIAAGLAQHKKSESYSKFKVSHSDHWFRLLHLANHHLH